MSRAGGLSTLWSKFSGSTMKLWGENAQQRNRNRGRRHPRVRKQLSLCLLLALHPFVVIALAHACVLDLVPFLFLPFSFPFEGNSYCAPASMQGGGFCCVEGFCTFLLWKQNLVCCEAFTTYSGWPTSKFRAYFTLLNFWVVLTAEEKHDYRSLRKVLRGCQGTQ